MGWFLTGRPRGGVVPLLAGLEVGWFSQDWEVGRMVLSGLGGGIVPSLVGREVGWFPHR